ncbi:MAG: cytochrome c family protein [Caulobacteraceae bacterium]
MRAALIFALASSALLAACSQPAPSTDQPSASAEPASAPAAPPVAAPAAAPPAAAAAMTPEARTAALAALPAPYNTADIENGQRKFALCRSCHTINQGGANMTGPNLHGVFGRKAGSLAGFNYSDAVKAAGFTWDGPHLDQWLTDPRGFMPGTRMTFAGLRDPKDRTDLIAYLMVESGHAQ